MNILENLNKNNLHHAYLIEGAREKIIPEILDFFKNLGVKVSGNPDFCLINLDSFKVEDARNLKLLSTEKGFSVDKKIFIISANSFLLEAQNTLLKMFEEPIENTHFFLIVPDTDALLKTLVSRFYVIKTKSVVKDKIANDFIKMQLPARLNYIKELLVEEEDEESIVLDSTRSKALKFLNMLEVSLHSKLGENFSDQSYLQVCLQQIFKVREYLRMPGSSIKTLMESVALVIPVLQ